MFTKKSFAGLMVGLMAVGIWTSRGLIPAEAQTRSRPKITFTKVPGPGGGADSRGDIAGKVTGLANPQNYKIVLYAHTDIWYVQPLTASPKTAIGRNGKWSNWTHLGLTYAALLVRPSYTPEDTTDKLPGVGGDILAVATVAASKR